MKPESVLKATRLIKTGEVIEIGQVLNGSMPFFGTRRFDVTTKRTFMNDGSNHRGSNEELVVGEMGQIGTQFDGFAHQTHEGSLYNCVKLDDIATRNGFTKFGIEKVGSLITRGVLIDVAALKGVEMLPDAYEITPADLQQALERQKLTLQPGDAVLIHTGWSRLWAKDNPRYVKSCPGIGIAAAAWLAKQDPMLVGADNWPVEVAPNPDSQLSLPVHQFMLVVSGIHLLENLKLDELAAEARARVRVRRPAAQDAGVHGVDGGAGRHSVTTGSLTDATRGRAFRWRGVAAADRQPRRGRQAVLPRLAPLRGRRSCEPNDRAMSPPPRPHL